MARNLFADGAEHESRKTAAASRADDKHVGAFRGTGFTYQLEVAGIDEPFKAEVTSEGQVMLLPLGCEIGLNWHPSACVLLEREEEA